MFLKGNMHAHTTCSDGKLTPQQVANIYSDLGYDFLAFTDHDYLLTGEAGAIYGAVKTDLLIFTGVELTVFEKGYVHVNRIEGDRETLHVLNHIGEYDLSFEQALERIEAVGRMYPLDAVEITTKGFPNKEYEVPEIKLPKLAADDAHTRIGCGRAWIELDCKRTRDSIIRAIRRGAFWNCYAKG